MIASVARVATQANHQMISIWLKRPTSKYMISVPLIDLKFLKELAAGGAGTSNRRH
jgi:hypothetical protein